MASMMNKIVGLCRFHAYTLFQRKWIHVGGIKQYLWRGARLEREQGGVISIGNGVFLGKHTSVGAYLDGRLVIGNNNYFSTNVNVVCLNNIEIGNNNLIAQNVVIVDHSHQYQNRDELICKQGYKLGRVIIGSDCWICANVVICPESIIGDRVIVAANSVVRGELNTPGIYAGNPARLVKEL